MTIERRWLGGVAACALAGVMATGCGDAGAEVRGEPVGAVQSEILNGWDMNDAAVKTWLSSPSTIRRKQGRPPGRAVPAEVSSSDPRTAFPQCSRRDIA